MSQGGTSQSSLLPELSNPVRPLRRKLRLSLMDLRLLSVVAASHALLWLRRLGGPGLILLGLADNSVIPMPASHRGWWPYYALMATAGAVLGGYITYRLAREGGKETLERKLSKDKADKLYKKFER